MRKDTEAVVLGPSWKHTDVGDRDGTAARAGEATDAIRSHVRQAAEELRGGLERAEHFTNGWSDEGRALALVDAAVSRCLYRLAETGCWGQENQRHSEELWRIAGRWLEVGSLQHRARFKPRGYAGDYLLLAQMCDEYVCEHPLGRVFDSIFQSQAAPAAVRTRTEQMASALVAHCLSREPGPFRVVGVGCGPAIELERALGVLPADYRAALEVTLLDLDGEALDYARSRIGDLLAPEQLHCVRENLPRLATKGGGSGLVGMPDFLYCTGLFDYLPEPAAVTLLGFFWERLAEGGQLLVGNFAPQCPSRAFMEWIGNWYLIYRTPEEMGRLAAAAGISSECYRVGAERLGVDLFLVAEKNSGD